MRVKLSGSAGNAEQLSARIIDSSCYQCFCYGLLVKMPVYQSACESYDLVDAWGGRNAAYPELGTVLIVK